MICCEELLVTLVLSLAHMAEEFTLEDLANLDNIHAQLRRLSRILEQQHVRDMARFDHLDRLLAQITKSVTTVNRNPGTPVYDIASASEKDSSAEAFLGNRGSLPEISSSNQSEVHTIDKEIQQTTESVEQVQEDISDLATKSKDSIDQV